MTKTKKVKVHGKERMHRLYNDMPIWKSLLILAFPSMIIMLVNGAYMFSDSLLSINFAADSYDNVNIPGLESGDLVRLFMNGGSPINMIMIAFSMMFAVGMATRVAINLGAKRHERALNTIKTGMTTGMLISVIMIPILIFSAKPWISSQYTSAGGTADTISNYAFDYIWIIIASFPLMMFNNIVSSLFRTEARMKEMMIAMIAPIFINLFMDWVLMGPAGMGVEGGAWATFISTAITSIILIVFMYKRKESMVVFKNMFTIRIQLVILFGIFLVGITPFIRNMAQSITSTVAMNVITSVSSHVYSGHAADIMSTDQHAMIAKMLTLQQIWPAHAIDINTNHHEVILSAEHVSHVSFANLQTETKEHQQAFMSALMSQHAMNAKDGIIVKEYASEFNAFNNMVGKDLMANQAANQFAPSIEANFMTKVITGVMPVFTLFFPIMFSFVQAANPVASYNYGAKNHKRVKQTYFFTILYATTAAIIIYFLASFALAGPLMKALQVSGAAYDRALVAIKIMMLSLPLFGVGIGAMVIFGATDKLFQSLIASSMQGLIMFWPAIFGFKEMAYAVDWEYIFWFYTPASALGTSVVNTLLVLHTLRHLDRPGHITIDERIEKVANWAKNKKAQKASKARPTA